MSKCRARVERISIQTRDEAFQSFHPKRFKSNSQKTGGSSLKVNGSLITHPPEVLQHWIEHFSVLVPTLQDVQEKIPIIEAQTHVDSNITLDTPFALEEVEAAINRLKKDSSGGPDTLSPHHLRHAGSHLKEWLCKIFNSITDLEAIPASFKAGIVIPVYKGKGKDPLSPKSYRGITLTSVMAKVLEFLLLDRILPVLNDNNLPKRPTKRESHAQMPSSYARKSSLSEFAIRGSQ